MHSTAVHDWNKLQQHIMADHKRKPVPSTFYSDGYVVSICVKESCYRAAGVTPPCLHFVKGAS